MADPESIQELSALARKRCAAPAWAQGEKLAREGAVQLEREAPDELAIRVTVPGWETPPTVVLYPDEQEWACDCGGTVAVCPHVAAALQALTRAAQRGEALAPVARAAGRVGYRLDERAGAAVLDRVVVTDDGAEAPLTGPLGSAPASPSEADRVVDRLLAGGAGSATLDALSPERLGQLLRALAECPDVRARAVPVRADDEPVLPRAVVRAQGEGFTVTLEQDPSVRARLGRALVLCGDSVRPVAQLTLWGEAAERLPRARVFARGEVAELVGAVLPALAEKVPVVVQTDRLPQLARALRPRVQMNLSQRDHTLAVVPEIVYGDPPCARVEGRKLVYLRGAVPVRDEAAEVDLVHRLRDALNLVPERRADFVGRDAAEFAARLRRWSDAGDAAQALYGAAPLVPQFRVGERDFELTFVSSAVEDAGAGAGAGAGDAGNTGGGEDVASAVGRASAQDVIRAWQEGLDLVPLQGGGWAPLPAAWLSKHGHRVADLLAARGDDGSVSPAMLPTLAHFCDELEHPRPPSLARLAPLLEDFRAIPAATLPDDLAAELRPYQRHGVDWLCFLREAGMGAVLADDMGLGKTLQTLCAARGRTLVVAPRSVVHNWESEIARFRPRLRASLYHGPRRALDPRADITLTTYAVLRLDAEALAAERWDTVVLDEAHTIKNPDSQVARAAFTLRGDFRVALTGTPVENRLEELWSLLHFTNRGVLGGRGDFRDRYEDPIGAGDADAAGRLRARIAPFVLRRLKRDVAPELPPRTDAVLRCELDERERAVYDAVRAAAQRDVVASLAAGGDPLAALEALLRLRQAACHSALVPGQRADNSSKLEAVLEALEQAAADGHKALVFSQWTSLLDLFEPHLRAADIAFVRLDGATRDRAGVVAEFQGEQGPPVMLVSLKAGGTGLNLTAADHVFLLDPWWNPAVEDQAADRAHRIGQDRPVMVYRVVATDTVEERILALQERKRALAAAALAGGEGALGLTREDLLGLLA